MKRLKVKNKTIILLAVFVFFIIGLSVFFLPVKVLAQETGVNSALKGLNETTDTGFGSGYAKSQENANLSQRIGTIVGALLAFIGVIFFLLIIYGGISWMIARGDEQKVTKAKDMITDAVIGLVIVLAAYAITIYISNVLAP